MLNAFCLGGDFHRIYNNYKTSPVKPRRRK